MKPLRPRRRRLFPVVVVLAIAIAAPCSAGNASGLVTPATSVVVAPGATGLTAAGVHAADPALAERAEDWIRGLTPGWMPNRGQVAGPDGRAVAGVSYSLHSPGSQILVTSRGVSVFLRAPADEASEGETRRGREDRTAAWSGLEIELVGASIRPERALAEGGIEELGEQNFYAPHCPDGVIGVPSYERITFRDVYPGIDWVLVAGRGRPVHQDFVVHPGADPARIRLRYRGAQNLRLEPDGRTLRLSTALGEVTEGPLHCYQRSESDTVPARFRLNRDLVTVKLGDWDRSRPLTIDPPLLWSTLYGGSSYDGPKSIYCDNLNGDIYVVGYTASPNLPCTTAVAPLAYFNGANQAPPDAFIWKFSQLGVRKWATYYAGNADEYATDCAVDRLGNLYVTGYTASTNFPTLQLPGAYWQPVKGSGIDAFLLRFNSQGVRQWATYYGGNSNDFSYAVTTDSTDHVIVVGSGGSSNLPLVNPGGGAYFQPALNGASDSFILRFNTLGALVWATYHGGDDADIALGVAVNGNSLYVVGETYSTVFPLVDPPGNSDYFQGAFGGFADAFISRFTTTGVQTWSTYYGGTQLDQARRPVFASSGAVYVVGITNSTDLPLFNPNPIATPNQPAYFQGTNAGQFDVFLLRFTSANARTWGTYVGGTNSEDLGRGARSIALDSRNRPHITGTSASNDFPLVNPGGGAYFQGSTTNSDVFYASFSPADSLEWSTFFGGGGGSFGTAVGIGLGDCLFGTGEFQSGFGFNTPPVNPPGLGSWFRTTSGGDDDGFITKFCHNRSACCVELNCLLVAGAAECAALNATAFHPNQTCAQTSCSILCNVCGRKFSDLNRNGVQDGGEPGLPGWTVELRDLSNAVYATAVTGANGDYCFNGIPCGSWLVTEATQNGWVKLAPTGAGHSLSLPLATTQNGVDFGNYACPTSPPCNPMPPGLVAWWPFDDGPGATKAADVTHAALGRNPALLAGGAASGDGLLCLAGPTAYAVVPATQQSALDFGSGSFGVSVWLRPDASSATGRVIVEKLGTSTVGGFAGWSLQLDGMQCVLRLETGSAPQVVSGPSLPASKWSHVVVSVDRTTGEGRWYLDGNPLPTAHFTPVAGSLANSADLLIGQSDPASGTGSGLQGCMAQLALFGTPVSADVAAKAFGPGPNTGLPVKWCPDYAVLPASRTICSTQNSVQVCFNIGNSSASPVTYSWSLAGLPAGPGCTNAGPTQFSPSSGTVTVPAGGLSGSICVTIARPNGFTQQAATACYALTFVNHTTGVCRTRTTTLKVDNSCWCGNAIPTGIVQVPASGQVVPFSVRLPCDPITSIAYRVRGLYPNDTYPTPLFLSLEGAAPGTDHLGTLSAGEGSDATVPVQVYFPKGYDPAALYELVLEADTDGDGVWEPLASSFVAPAPNADGTTGVSGERGALRPGLLTSPNPFLASTSLGFSLAQAEPVSLEVYDFSGRLVRSLVRGWLEAGTRRVIWDGRDNGGRRMPPGVYLARLRTRSGTQEARLVKVR